MTDQATTGRNANATVPNEFRKESRSVTMLPRHWEWLDAHSRSANGALRLLIEDARRDRDGVHRVRESKERCYQFMRDIAGNRAHFEEAIRALFAGDAVLFHENTATWPAAIRQEIKILSAPVWAKDREAENAA